MGFTEIVMIAFGLSMDAFSASISKGLSDKTFKAVKSLAAAFVFGLFQALMPLAGWFIGRSFSGTAEAFDHWIAFFLLTFIGVKMIYESLSDKSEEEQKESVGELLLIAAATSIDAFTAGIVFAAEKADPVIPVFIIGAVTFAVSFAGGFIGSRFGSVFDNKAEVAGGCVLILIGVEMLIEGIK